VTGPRSPFPVDPEQALAALLFTWQDQCDDNRVTAGGQWRAHRRGGSDDDVITAPTPEELNLKIRQDWLRREGAG
jgi:hypothetical protein